MLRAKSSLILTVPIVLACGGLGQLENDRPPASPLELSTEPGPVLAEPEAPAQTEAAFVLVVPTTKGERCELARSDSGQVLATFDLPCDRWSGSGDPTRPDDAVFAHNQAGLQRTTGPLPELPDGRLDAVGFSAEGVLHAFVRHSVPPVVSEDRSEAWLSWKGERYAVDPDLADVFEAVLCEPLRLDEKGASWVAAGSLVPVSLYEGSTEPFCVHAEGAPRIHQVRPGEGRLPIAMDGEVPAVLREMLESDEMLEGVALAEPALALGSYWMEGANLTTPLVASVDGSWQVIEGFDVSGDPVGLELRGRWLIACTRERSAVFDVEAGFAEKWSREGPCPSFWPLAVAP